MKTVPEMRSPLTFCLAMNIILRVFSGYRVGSAPAYGCIFELIGDAIPFEVQKKLQRLIEMILSFKTTYFLY